MPLKLCLGEVYCIDIHCGLPGRSAHGMESLIAYSPSSNYETLYSECVGLDTVIFFRTRLLYMRHTVSN